MEKKIDKALLRIPFDQYSRQKIAKDMIDSLRSSDEGFTILDVGGYKGATPQMQPLDDVTVLDLYEVKEKGYIRGDGTNMPLEDKSFDFVVSFDVLEHITKKDRKKFIAECCRVARRGVVIAHPIKTSLNQGAESFLNDLYFSLHNNNHEWLTEHIEYVLPEKNLAVTELQNNGYATTSVNSNDLMLWTLMQTVIFTASKIDNVGHHIDDLYEYYNRNMNRDGGDKLEDNYRIIAAGFRDERDASKVAKKFSSNKQSDKLLHQKKQDMLQTIGKVYVQSFDELFEYKEKLVEELESKKTELENIASENDSIKTELSQIRNSKTYALSSKLSAAARRLGFGEKKGRR